MDRLREEIRLLTAKLEALHPLPGTPEDAVIELLQNLGAAADKAHDARLLSSQILGLEHYWLHHVEWCSVLSKEIEKILILQEELSAS